MSFGSSRALLFLAALAPLAFAACSEDDPPAAVLAPANDAGATEAAAPIDSGPPAPPPPKLDPLGPQFVDLGEQPAEFDLDVPEGTLGFEFYPLGAEGDPIVTIQSITDAKGKTYTPADVAKAWGDFPDLGRFPQSSAILDVPPGKWKVKLSAPALSVPLVRQRTTDGKFHGGKLDIWCHIPIGLHVDALDGEAPPDAVTPANAAANPVVKSSIDLYFQALKKVANLDRGEVTFVEAPAKYVRLETEEAFHDAEGSVALEGAEQLGIHFLFTELVVNEERLGYAAVGGGTTYDRPQGLIAIRMKGGATPELAETRRILHIGAYDYHAIAMLHEGFHWLGLLHTSTPDVAADYDDGFTDTGPCPNSMYPDHINECPDSHNVMFTSPGGPTIDSVLSPHQLAVIHASPLYHPYAPGP